MVLSYKWQTWRWSRLWQVAIGLTFVIAAMYKVSDPVPAARALYFVGLKVGLLGAVVGLILLEVAVGLCLILPGSSKLVNVIAVAMLSGFSLFLLTLLMIPKSPSCGCFAASFFTSSARAEQATGLARNIGLLLFGYFCFFLDRRRVRSRSSSSSPKSTLDGGHAAVQRV